MTEPSQQQIMIVEDEGIIAESLKQTLQDQGYDVVGTAAQAEEAKQIALNETPDLVLMDISLANDDSGIDAASSIQEKLDTAILFLTAYKNEKVLERTEQLDHEGYVTKPITEPELLSAVQNAM